jgi:hypothetical protein
LSTVAAAGYALSGGVGAAVLAMVAPMLMHNYTDCHGRRSGGDCGPAGPCGDLRIARCFILAVLAAAALLTG